MNFTDLFVVLALVSGIYTVLVLLTRDRHFLTKAVNPYRGAWILAGVTAIWAGVGILRWETGSWNIIEWLEILSHLITDQKMSQGGKAASVAILFGLLMFSLVAWCYFTLPRDPSTFHRPEDRRRAFHYYINALRGGLDYAALVRGENEILEESWDPRQIGRVIQHLPRVAGGEGPRHERTVEEQVAFWREVAQKIHRSMAALDEVISPAHQGPNRRILFDCEFGGIFFIYLRQPDSRDPDGDCLYLFGATLHQHNMNERIADNHFALLLAALRSIEHGIKMA